MVLPLISDNTEMARFIYWLPEMTLIGMKFTSGDCQTPSLIYSHSFFEQGSFKAGEIILPTLTRTPMLTSFRGF